MRVNKMSVTLPCSKFLADGRRCGKETNLCVSIPTQRGDIIVFPYCREHLPIGVSSDFSLAASDVGDISSEKGRKEKVKKSRRRCKRWKPK